MKFVSLSLLLPRRASKASWVLRLVFFSACYALLFAIRLLQLLANSLLLIKLSLSTSLGSSPLPIAMSDHEMQPADSGIRNGARSFDNGKSLDGWANPAISHEKAVDDWLPVITGSRNAKWWYSAFHNVTAMVGAGVLGLPSAMTYLGWGPGVIVLVLSWVISLYTLLQMVDMHEMVPGRRFDRYHELGQHAFGEKLGLWIVIPQQLIVQVSTDIIYMVTGGTSLQKFHDMVCPRRCHSIRLTFWIMIFASVHFVLAQLPNFNSTAGVSLAAAVMSLSYSTIAWTASAARGHHGVSYSYRDRSASDEVFGVFTALGTIAFAYAGHNVGLEIQATIPSAPSRPSKIPMRRGVLVAYAIVAICYFPVALVGYWSFGNTVADNVLDSLQHPTWLIALANFMVVIHVIGSYQIYAMPVYDMLEMLLVKRFHLPHGVVLRLVARSAYVALTCFVAMCIPFFRDLLGFFGGFAFAPSTYFLPCMMWLAIHKPRRFSLSWIANWVCILLGVLLMLVSSIGGLREIIVSASKYKFFSSSSLDTT